MKKIKIRNLTLGEGLPAICVPLTGSTEEEVLRQAEAAAVSEADVVEWRADLCGEIFEEVPAGKAAADTDERAQSPAADTDERAQKIAGMLQEIRKRIGAKALLLTVRTKKEGGAAEIDAKAYGNLLESAVKQAPGAVDMIDIEFSAGAETAGRLIQLAEREGTVSVLSAHDFEKTPEDKDLEALAKAMDCAGADMVKIAVMPRHEEDVKRLRALAETIKNGLIKRPHILISMGDMGKETRLGAEELGSVLTFGALTEEQASAPGQVAVSGLKKELLRRHRP